VCGTSFGVGDQAMVRFPHFCMVGCIRTYAWIFLFNGKVNDDYFILVTETFLSLARWLLTPMAFIFPHVMTALCVDCDPKVV
jgi:hypothetical protein